MKVYKFGGTSVGTPANMKNVAEIIQEPGKKIVVLSALSGTTNALVSISALHQQGEKDLALIELNELRKHYDQFLKDIYEHPLTNPLGWNVIEDHFHELSEVLNDPADDTTEGFILAQGELMSTALFHFLLLENGIDNQLLPALDFMRIDENGEPDLKTTKTLFEKTLQQIPDTDIYISQGYICKNPDEEITNLQRGGSDYTATILGALAESEEIQIWTDIDGVHNNDPRIVKDTFPIRYLSYREAAELAYFGAKILHPTCVLPAEKQGVPIRLKNTMDPQAPGTLISGSSSKRPVAAIAAKDGITVINIHSHRMLMAYGFLRKVFEVFENYRTPIDMITTSEVAVSLTIDRLDHLEEIIKDLQAFGEVKYSKDQTIVCLVGDEMDVMTGYAKKIFHALQHIPIRMISYGGSKNNVSILINSQYKQEALVALNDYLFEPTSV